LVVKPVDKRLHTINEGNSSMSDTQSVLRRLQDKEESKLTPGEQSEL
jgi:hypothetical protein